MNLTDSQVRDLFELMVATMNVSMVWGVVLALVSAVVFAVVSPIFSYLLDRFTAPLFRRLLARRHG